MDGGVLTELLNGILSIMECRIASVILYGSVARGTDETDSDVDVEVCKNKGAVWRKSFDTNLIEWYCESI